jgi:hypothetical protein
MYTSTPLPCGLPSLRVSLTTAANPTRAHAANEAWALGRAVWGAATPLSDDGGAGEALTDREHHPLDTCAYACRYVNAAA